MMVIIDGRLLQLTASPWQRDWWCASEAEFWKFKYFSSAFTSVRLCDRIHALC